MSRSDSIVSLMADEVLKDIQEKGVNFHKAFARAAHRRGVFHRENSESREQYNTWFAKVRAKVSEKNKLALKKSLPGERAWQHGKIVQTTTCRRRKWRADDVWGHADLDNYIFEDGSEQGSSPTEGTASDFAPSTFHTPRGRIKPGIRTEP